MARKDDGRQGTARAPRARGRRGAKASGNRGAKPADMKGTRRSGKRAGKWGATLGGMTEPARLHAAAVPVRGRTRWGTPRRSGVVRYAVVGLGYFAQVAVLPAFANAPNARLAALVSDDAAKRRQLQRRYGVAIAVDYDGYDDLLESGEVDAVYIALPNDLHRDYAVRAAERGVHVLVEKPMAMDPQECREMIEAARDNHVRLMVAYRLHFESANLAAMDAVRKGRLGDVRAFDSVFCMPVAEGNIRTDRRHGGGPLFDIGIYCINAARYIFRAEPVDVVARAVARPDPRFREVDEAVSVVMSFPGDRLATFTASFGAASLGRYTVVGTKGSLTLDNAYDFAIPMDLEVRVGSRVSRRHFPKRDQVGPELLHFSRCILEGRDPEPSGKEGLVDMEVIHAIQEAANTGRRVSVGGPQRQRRPTGRLESRMRARPRPRLIHVQEPHKD